MMFHQALLLCAAAIAQAAVATTACNADNCLRAVRGTAFSTRLGTSDCSRYQRTTVTPITTITVVGPSVVSPNPAASSNPAIPTYASACSSFSRYQSACRCAGVSPIVVSAALTSTVTFTTTAAAPACATFIARVASGPGVRFPGGLVTRGDEVRVYDDVDPTKFRLNSDGTVSALGLEVGSVPWSVASNSEGSNGGHIRVDGYTVGYDNPATLACAFEDPYGVTSFGRLTCKVTRYPLLTQLSMYDRPNDPSYGGSSNLDILDPNSAGEGYFPVSVYAYPAC